MSKTFIDFIDCKVSAGAVRQVSWLQRSLLAVVGILGLGGSLLAAETRVIVADPSLSAGPVHRLLLGADYRDLWTTPVEIEVLDLSKEAGGLTPQFRVGGAQTFGLALKGADGKSYTFRSLIKDQALNLHESLRGYAIGRIFQDQQAALHPAATSMVPPLAKAAGVLHNTPRLVLLPDDPALGEFRELFAGRLGTIEEFPTPAADGYAGFNGATEIIKSFDIVTQWLASPDVRIDARELLRLRLFDFFLGDWDRHANNHRWAKIPGKAGWQPIPEDRDNAFVDFQGALLSLARPFEPRLFRFEKDYPGSFGLTTQGWPIHRWFLAELERDVWLEIANDLRNRITDDVIDEAVSLMPEAYLELSAAKLASTLRVRRDRIPQIAERIYRYMAAEVDVQATDESERVDLRRVGKGQIEVSVALASGEAPYFKRVLNANETKSLRVYLRGGRNTLVCHGLGHGSIKIDVVGSQASDALQGCRGANLRFTESEEIERRKTDLRISPDPFEKVGLPSLNVPPESDRPRDWRSGILPNYIVRASSNEGVVVGGGFTLTNFEFGKNPFGQSHTLTGAVSLTRGAVEATYAGLYQHWNPRLQSSFDASISGIKQADFYGFGNDTSDDGDSDLFETEQTRITLTPGLNYVYTPELTFFTGAGLNYNSTDDDEDTLLTDLAPLGVGDFGWVSLFGGFDYDTRDRSVLNSAGLHIRLQGSHSPSVWDAEGSFTNIEGEIAGFYSVGSRALLALRVGGEHVAGSFPFQEAAYIGGADNVRGLDTDRFAGDASVFSNIELRYSLGEASAYFARAEYGLFGFVDVGRVFLEGEDEDDLHPSAGGGLSLTGLDRTFLVSLAVARSEERTSGVFSAGFSF